MVTGAVLLPWTVIGMGGRWSLSSSRKGHAVEGDPV